MALVLPRALCRAEFLQVRQLTLGVQTAIDAWLLLQLLRRGLLSDMALRSYPTKSIGHALLGR